MKKSEIEALVAKLYDDFLEDLAQDYRQEMPEDSEVSNEILEVLREDRSEFIEDVVTISERVLKKVAPIYPEVSNEEYVRYVFKEMLAKRL